MANLLQYHKEALEGRWGSAYRRGQCKIVTNNPQHYTEQDVLDHTCWVVVGRKGPRGHIFYLGSRFTVKAFSKDNKLLSGYTHRAVGQGESFLIPLWREWFDQLYRTKKEWRGGFHFMWNEELAAHFERVVGEEHARQAARVERRKTKVQQRVRRQ